MPLTQVDQGLLSSTAQYTGFKNRVINGGMVVSQGAGGASVTPLTTATYAANYPVDRFAFFVTQASKLTTQQSSNAPAGFTQSVLVTSSSAFSLGATDVFQLYQQIEGYNVADLSFGSASAKTVTVSFWVQSSLTGTFGGFLANSAQNRVYPFSYTISAANTWEKKTITIVGETTGTWLTTNGKGMTLVWNIGNGSSYQGTANAWNNGGVFGPSGAVNLVSTSGATFYLTGVQLEVGSTATSFDYRPYGTELALCQRYAWNFNSANANGPYARYGCAYCYATTGGNAIIKFPVTMRTIPSLTRPAVGGFAVYYAGAVYTCTLVDFGTDGSSTEQAVINFNVSSGLAAGGGAGFLSANNQVSYLLFTAEL